ncbi:MAG: peptidylprolyl isomerase [Sedimentisphaerales bacterium]|nr:peptidylprolyl isomerase [Sedimentisphaerales bacterium]
MALMVNGELIEDSTIQDEADRIRPQYEKTFKDMDAKEREAQLLKWSKENLIEKTLLQQEVIKNEPEVSKETLDSVLENLKKECKKPSELYKDFGVENDENLLKKLELIIRTQQKLEKLHNTAKDPALADIEKYYEENKNQFKQQESIRVAHIVKYYGWKCDEATAYKTISQAYEEIQKGSSFELIVDKHTDCNDMGGDIGYIRKGQMVGEFDDVVFNLGVGQVSNIFRTRYGFHIAKVYDRKPAFIPELEHVKDQIQEILKKQLQSQIVYDYLDELKNKAKIEEVQQES